MALDRPSWVLTRHLAAPFGIRNAVWYCNLKNTHPERFTTSVCRLQGSKLRLDLVEPTFGKPEPPFPHVRQDMYRVQAKQKQQSFFDVIECSLIYPTTRALETE